jgi:hypothetical protein
MEDLIDTHDFEKITATQARKVSDEKINNIVKNYGDNIIDFQKKRFEIIGNNIEKINNLSLVEPKTINDLDSLIGQRINILHELIKDLKTAKKVEESQHVNFNKVLLSLIEKKGKVTKGILEVKKEIKEKMKKVNRLLLESKDSLKSLVAEKRLIGVREPQTKNDEFLLKLAELKSLVAEKRLIGVREPQTKNDEFLLKLAERNNSAGTVATVGGFAGVTTASIIARIIGNSTANYLSPHSKNIIRQTIGNKKDDNKNIKKGNMDHLEFEKLKNQIQHLEELENNRKNRGQKLRVRKMNNIKKKRKSIGVINIINHL